MFAIIINHSQSKEVTCLSTIWQTQAITTHQYHQELHLQEQKSRKAILT